MPDVAAEVLGRLGGVAVSDGFLGLLDVGLARGALVFEVLERERHDAALVETGFGTGLGVPDPCGIPALLVEGEAVERVAVPGVLDLLERVDGPDIAGQPPPVIGQGPVPDPAR